MKYLSLVLLVLLCALSNLKAENDYFYFDMVCFKGDSAKPCIDINIMTPFQTLRFKPKSDYYFSKYNVSIIIYDTNGTLISKIDNPRTIKSQSYFESIGGDSKYDAIQKRIYLSQGKYQVKILIKNEFDNSSFEKSKRINIPNFNAYNYALSGISLLSSIEEKPNGGYIVTPHLSDNIGLLNKYFFTFFESYAKIEDSVDIYYEIIDSKNNSLSRIKTSVFMDSINRTFQRIEILKKMGADKSTLRITVARRSDKENYENNNILAQTERVIYNKPSAFGVELEDIDKTIRYLSYVASQNEIDYIKAGATNSDRLERFLDYWQKLDPSPGTQRNEAYEEYFSRIEYANKKFKTYAEGWLSDMGKVFIIYGPPASVDKREQMSGNRVVEYWSYTNGKNFTFIDNSNFGYYELASPLSPNEKYKYSGTDLR